MVYEYEYDEETQKMRVNAMYSIYGSSIEDYDVVMAKTIDNLTELKKVVRIVFADTREHEYDFRDCRLLLEIALVIEKISKNRMLSIKNLAQGECKRHVKSRHTRMQKIISSLRYDPIEAYKNIIREIRHTKIKIQRNPNHVDCYQHYINNTLTPIENLLSNCELIEIAKPDLAKHKNRSLYRKIFHPTVRPNFMYTRYATLPPENSELIERYKVKDANVEIYQIKGKTRKLYQVIPKEFRLNEDEYILLDAARDYIGRHEPREAELAEPERVRENLFRIGIDMIRDISESKSIPIDENKIRELSDIL
ncbi:hypothetical protein ACFLQN_04935, partial [Candidatus Aenigmatarchaeota archaeon]